jgi:nicotinate-nucleotide--dimethylbenzimidazole phosphoribosyltransferase
MQDTRLGTYGCAVLSLYLHAKVSLISAAGQSTWALNNCSGGGPALVASHVLSRCTAAPLINIFDYVDEGGPKGNYYGWFQKASKMNSIPRVVVALLSGLCISVALYGWHDSCYLFATLVFSVIFSGLYGRRILGGVMGDFLGATICITELAMLSTLNFLPKVSSLEHFIANTMNMDVEQWQAQLKWPPILGSEAVVVVRLVVVVSIVYLWSVAMQTWNAVKVRRMKAKHAEESETATNEGDDNLGTQISDGDDARLSNVSTPYLQQLHACQAEINTLAKPLYGLGSLEGYCARLGAIQGCKGIPATDNAITVVFGADHGVAKSVEHGGEACSAFPSSITRNIFSMIRDDKAAVNQLAKTCGTRVYAFDVGICSSVSPGDEGGVEGNYSPGDSSFKSSQGTSEASRKSSPVVLEGSYRLSDGTSNFCTGSAMSMEEAKALIKAGEEALDTVAGNEEEPVHIIALGEIGIGNTTTAAALYCALLSRQGVTPEQVCGRGTGLDEEGIQRKIEIVRNALDLHAEVVKAGDPMRIMAALGGAEIVALVGAINRAHQMKLAIVVDGFIVSAAALLAAMMNPSVTENYFLASLSSETGHAIAIREICAIAQKHGAPLPGVALDMGLSMGEGTASTLLVPVLRAAAAVQGIAKLADVI